MMNDDEYTDEYSFKISLSNKKPLKIKFKKNQGKISKSKLLNDFWQTFLNFLNIFEILEYFQNS